MSSLITSSSGLRRIEVYIDGKRYRIRLGRIEVTDARTLQVRIDDAVNGDRESEQWLERLGSQYRSRLARAGILKPKEGEMKRPMFTYFVQRESGGPIKIGKTDNIRTRMSTLQSGSLETLVCIAYLDGCHEDELHERFHSLCICGEWFRDDPQLMQFIQQHATPAAISCPLPSPEKRGSAFALRKPKKKRFADDVYA